jgi:hypothetical protein
MPQSIENHEQDNEKKNFMEIVKQIFYTKGQKPPIYIYIYVVLVGMVSLGVLFCLFFQIPDIEKPGFENLRYFFIITMAMTLCCGSLGGCLFDLRGLIHHSSVEDFNINYIPSYILRPFAGALSGFIVFLVLVGGLFALNVQPPDNNSDNLEWIILRSQLPFMAFSALAGYSSNVFMMKLKQISEAVFSPPEQ